MERILPAFLLVSILIVPGFAYLGPTSQGSQYSPSAVTVAGQVPATNITLYAPYITHNLVQTLDSYLSRWSSSVSVYGNLVEFRVPSSSLTMTDTYLSTLSTVFGFSYFSSNSSLVFSPQITFMTGASGNQAPSEYLPSTIYKAYNYSYANSKNIYGNGTTIVIIDAYGDPYLKYDLSAFDNLTGLPPISITKVFLNTTTPLQFNRSWAVETAMDVEWAHASAPGARIVLVVAQNAGSGLEDAVSYAVSKDLGNVISLSWGAPESSLVSQVGKSGVATLAKVYSQAYDEGITVFAASGDNGAYDTTQSLTVNFPASDPLVTGVGGTSLLRYENKYEENGWGGSNTAGTFGSGGGYSSIYKAPSWQSAQGFSGTKRGVPDVSAVADKYTGVLVVYGGSVYQAGGTSLSTPIWAGIASRLDQFAGHPIGFMNPLLYQIARTPLYGVAFNKILKGTNGYYSVAPGWNPVTGLGSPNVSGLLKAYSEITSSYGFTIKGENAYNTTAMYATVNLNTWTTPPDHNTTTYYYESFYYNSSSYVRFGIAVNYSGVYALTQISNGSKQYVDRFRIESYPYSNTSFNLSLKYSGYTITVSSGTFSKSYNLFIPYIGASLPAMGAQVTGSNSNNTNFTLGTFSDIRILNSGMWGNFTSYYETHYSGIQGDPGYSSISGYVQNGTVTVERTATQINGFQGGNATITPEVTYMLSYTNPVRVVFGIHGNLSSKLKFWTFEGKGITGNSKNITVSGFYTISAVTSTVNISRTFFIQNTTSSRLNISNPLSGLQIVAELSFNHFFSRELNFSGNASLNYTTIAGSNTLTIRAKGYNRYSESISSGSTVNSLLSPVEPTLTLYVSPGTANVSIGPTIIYGNRGKFTATVQPGLESIKAISPGYSNFSEKLFIYPGKNLTLNIHMVPHNNSSLVRLSGFVRDGNFYFSLQGVRVSIGNITYDYTNSTGNFTIYLPAGNYSLDFSIPIYNDTVRNVNLSRNQRLTVDMYGAGFSSEPFYSVTIHYAFPIFFFFLYLTWSSQTSVSTYAVYYSTSPDLIPNRVVNISGSQHYTILDITPGKTYYVQIFGYSPLGKITSSKEVIVYGTNIMNILLNSLMIAGIAIYAAVAVRYARRVFMKKRS